jgi:hypothetical protein
LKWWDGDRKRDQSCSPQSFCSFLAFYADVHHVQTIETATMISGASAETLVDPTEARSEARRCFGRSDRSRLVPRKDITPGQRGVMVRNADPCLPRGLRGMAVPDVTAGDEMHLDAADAGLDHSADGEQSPDYRGRR